MVTLTLITTFVLGELLFVVLKPPNQTSSREIRRLTGEKYRVRRKRGETEKKKRLQRQRSGGKYTKARNPI
jgi:hypothetical protein